MPKKLPVLVCKCRMRDRKITPLFLVVSSKVKDTPTLLVETNVIIVEGSLYHKINKTINSLLLMMHKSCICLCSV